MRSANGAASIKYSLHRIAVRFSNQAPKPLMLPLGARKSGVLTLLINSL